MATIATILFFGGYWLLMRRDTHLGMRRAFLVASLLLALTLPAIQLRVSLPAHFSNNSPQPVLTEWHSTPESTTATAVAADGGNMQMTLQYDNQGLSHFAVQYEPAAP